MSTIEFDATTFQSAIIAFSKTLSRTPVTKTTSNETGDETLTDGTPEDISGAFYRKEDVWNLERFGLIDNADAILLVLPSVTINKDDKITYDGETYRIQKVTMRRLGTVEFYYVAQCFKYD